MSHTHAPRARAHTHFVLYFVISNQDEFVLVSEAHRIFTRQVAYVQTNTIPNRGIKTHNKLPPFIMNVYDNSKTF
jgi:hypothetical protein